MGRLQNIKDPNQEIRKTDGQTLWLIGYIQSEGGRPMVFWIIRRSYANSRFLTEEMRNL